MALPYPFLELKQKDEYQSFANALFNIAMEILRKPPALLLLPKFLQDQLPQVISLSEDGFRVMNHLVEIAEKRLDGDERLLGYNLVQIFAQNIKGLNNREEDAKIDELIRSLESHEDEGVRLLMLNVPGGNTSTEDWDMPVRRGRGRGRGRRGRGRKRRVW